MQERAQGGAVGCAGALPICMDRVPALAQALLVGVAVLRDEGGDAPGVPHGEAEADRRAVVEDVERVAGQPERVGEPGDHLGQAVEGVGELFAVGRVGEAKAGQVWGDEVVVAGEVREEIAEHVRGSRETVEQEQRRVFG